ncbi:MAG: phosphoglucosamine mutase [Clostridia bacterium]|nr:phosphoglucosamine mutase [Clostridia bacterium]
MSKYFGTDGFRGEANVNLTVDHAYKIGKFIGWYYGQNKKNGERARIVIGKDTRRSSYMFEDVLAGAIASTGAEACLLHVTTTPSVAYVARTEDFDCGVMITASHNPFKDNGIKLINCNGEKMDDKTIEAVEQYIDGIYRPEGISQDTPWDIPLATGGDIGVVVDYVCGRNRYVGYLVSLARFSFRGMKVGLDCANGSAWQIAKSVFDTLGADTYVINNKPDGVNVNLNAGSTHMEGLQKLVVDNKLDIGFAFDGDADRCLAVDENGKIVNGDEIMYIYAKYMHSKGSFEGTKLVTTVMSNFGLYKALDELGIGYEKTKVGDKYVYENMVANNHILGGEQSGHIIFRKYATTGDGMITALKVMQCMLEQKSKLSELVSGVTMYPQVLKNVVVTDKETVFDSDIVKNAVKKCEDELGDTGRILLRPSGTEPLVRVMAEAKTLESCEEKVDYIINSIKEAGMLIKIK